MKKLTTAINITSLTAVSVLATVGLIFFVDEVLAGISTQNKGVSVNGNTLTIATDNVIWGYADSGSNAASHLLKLQTKSGVSYTDRLRVGIDGTITLGSASGGAELRLGKYASKPACVSSTNEGAVVYDTANDRPYVCGPSDIWLPL